jgi:hypothetical protein
MLETFWVFVADLVPLGVRYWPNPYWIAAAVVLSVFHRGRGRGKSSTNSGQHKNLNIFIQTSRKTIACPCIQKPLIRSGRFFSGAMSSPLSSAKPPLPRLHPKMFPRALKTRRQRRLKEVHFTKNWLQTTLLISIHLYR